VEWHALNMESLDAAWGPGNALCFGRSGWAGDHSVTPVTWGGDQETSFARDDGMPSAREIGVGLGLSGVGRYGSDIAGFTSVWSDPATKELWFRWVAMGAFEPVMRTHDGLADEENWNWEKDEETTAHFARYASLHMRLQPFWLALDRAYREEGLPFLRHAVLVEPAPATDAADRGAWEALRDAPDQHFLGDSLLVAPVMEEGATSRSVVLPRGRWYSLLDEGESWDGGGGGGGGPASVVTVDAPISEIPVFVRAGSILPMLPAEVVTSYAASDPSVLDTGDRADALDLEVFDGPAGSLTLADGSAWTFSGGAMSWAGGAGAITLDGQPLAPGCADDAASNCLESLDIPNGTATLRIDWGEGPRVLAGKGWELRTSEGGGLSSRLGLRSPPGAGK
jgi:alpha-glucosidase (family GH31 glycosyl hydrolase)